MAKGDSVQLHYFEYTDEDTGARVIRLTPPDIICHRNYFYQKCFLDNGRKLIFAGEFSGTRNYYLLDIASGDAKQLTEGPGDNTFGGFLSPDEKYLFYVKSERTLMRVTLATQEESVVYRVPDDWVGYGTWVANADCNKLVGVEIHRDSWRPISDWTVFQEFYAEQPRCRVIRISLENGERETLLEENQWLGHPIYRPFDDNTVAFCHEGPLDQVDARMWLMNEDGSHIRKAKEPAPGESYTHEFWVPDGSALMYVTYVKDSLVRWLCRVNGDSGKDEKLIAMPPCSHVMSNDSGTLVVGDGSGKPIDIADNAGYGDATDPYLYLFDIARKQTHKVARHSSSWRVLDGDRQVTHPHPSFTPDEKQVLFSSDKDGLPALYLADIPDHVLRSIHS
ncbi:oligogalacturonate lyase family protein [Enterobacter kobei]|uniref:oligogalacturonate lyase family protein n=1 Tax=Enterobacter kobei TaxID=208224 RepID=UPI0028D36B78|nr:oligogalacturonate lyase family protein [Enterobacter kobei]WNP36689.1 oligogalacturonate lyase family protein [Enterobacter kobei]